MTDRDLSVDIMEDLERLDRDQALLQIKIYLTYRRIQLDEERLAAIENWYTRLSQIRDDWDEANRLYSK